MSAIKLLSATNSTVTISRDDFEMLLNALENAEDLAAVAAHDAQMLAAGGWEPYKRSCVTGDELTRLLNGEHPLIVWREKRGLSQRALAEKAGVSPGYLSEIESRKKPGSVHALAVLAKALEITIDDLVDTVKLSSEA
jgi:DNA-binding XRE family transcriptional regulator